MIEELHLRCACGWETSGSEEDVIAAATAHGADVHNMRPTRDDVLAMVIRNHAWEAEDRDLTSSGD